MASFTLTKGMASFRFEEARGAIVKSKNRGHMSKVAKSCPFQLTCHLQEAFLNPPERSDLNLYEYFQHSGFASNVVLNHLCCVLRLVSLSSPRLQGRFPESEELRAV